MSLFSKTNRIITHLATGIDLKKITEHDTKVNEFTQKLIEQGIKYSTKEKYTGRRYSLWIITVVTSTMDSKKLDVYNSISTSTNS